ncbi:MAG: DUF2891 domain-containing protein [Caulobacteraceae bacterium]
MSGPLDRAFADRLAAIALGHVGREYPNILVHALDSAADAATPRELHPIFYGSFDWHSSVHSHWMLARLLRLFPDLPRAPAIRAWFSRAFTQENVAGELAYLRRPRSGGFERPYGWAWLLKLAGELYRNEDAAAPGWRAALAPLGEAFAQRFMIFLPKADYPVRAGTHGNTAFALILAIDYAETVGDAALLAAAKAKAVAWYGADAGCQAWEPSGDDFLSPALIEAELMRRVLPAAAFRDWFAAFLPDVAAGAPATLFVPARVSDRADGKIAHLDGLNLSRAWCWRGIAGTLDPGDRTVTIARGAADLHLAASLPHVAGDYMGEHWLASFAVLALLA